MTITITLPPETEEKLRRRAGASGQSVDAYVRRLVETDVGFVEGGNQNNSSMKDRFEQLAAEWRSAVAPLSSVTRIIQHPAYQQIIALGPEVVPLILNDLEHSPDHWFAALQALTGTDPVTPEERGRLDRMAAAWVRWGKEHGHTNRRN